MDAPALEAQGLEKRYGARWANKDVSLTLEAGSIHALVGENGAGKTTVCKMLFGLTQPSQGTLKRKGHPLTLLNPAAAMAAGISMVHQHFMLVRGLTVAENVMLGQEDTRCGALDVARTAAWLAHTGAALGLELDPHARVETLPVGVAQRVEILKALHRGAKVLLLDEPTAVLTPQEVEGLLAVLRKLAGLGHAILLITHKLPEVLAVSDTVTVMRAGRVVHKCDTKDTNAAQLSALMVGRPVDLGPKARTSGMGACALRLEHLTVLGQGARAQVDDLTLTVRQGEIVGVAGVEGNGQTQLLEAVCGVLPVHSGQVFLGHTSVNTWTVRQRRDAGLAHIPEDRLAQGLVPAWPITQNTIVGWHHRDNFCKHGWMRQEPVVRHAQALVAQYDVRPSHEAQLVGHLSGGNQQKVLMGRELGAMPKVLVVSQPCRGVDVGAMELIHAALLRARDAGLGVLLLSVELMELLALCDVIHVMYRGRLVHTANAAATSAQALGPHMLGAGTAS